MKSKSKRTKRKSATISALALCTFSFTLAFSGASLSKQSTVFAASVPSNQLQQETDSIINQYVANGFFSGQVLLAKHGTILVDKTYGYGNISNKQTVKAGAHFAIGALTQSFMAVAIMQLQEKGLLNVTDPVIKFLPNLGSVGQQITIRELLSHTSGAPGTNGQTVAPGSQFQYSVLNYILLSQVIGQVSGESYTAYIQQHILTPLGMSNTGFINKLSDVPNSATGYAFNNNTVTSSNFDSTGYEGSDDMYSTADDMYLWDQALYTGRLVTRQDLMQLFTADPISVATLKTSGYGFGWQISPDGGMASNESTFQGFHSLIGRDMKDDITVIILTNEEWSPLDEIVNDLWPSLQQTSIPAGNASSTVAGQKKIVVNSKTISSPFGRVALNTTYMPIWYIGQSLQSLGIQESWDGTNRVWNIVAPSTAKIDLSGINLGSGNTDIYLNGQLVKRINTYAWLDPANGYSSSTVYAPIFYIQQLLSAAGVENQWNGHIFSTSAQFGTN